jgi:hypothetical protein
LQENLKGKVSSVKILIEAGVSARNVIDIYWVILLYSNSTLASDRISSSELSIESIKQSKFG